jgi:hypothetical protein
MSSTPFSPLLFAASVASALSSKNEWAAEHAFPVSPDEPIRADAPALLVRSDGLRLFIRGSFNGRVEIVHQRPRDRWRIRMNFAHQLREAGKLLSALQMAEAVSPLLSRRTVENWLNGSNAPAAWMRDTILTRVRRANECAERRQPPRNAGT